MTAKRYRWSKRHFNKQLHRQGREYLRACTRHCDRHTRWIEYAVAKRLCPTDEECPF